MFSTEKDEFTHINYDNCPNSKPQQGNIDLLSVERNPISLNYNIIYLDKNANSLIAIIEGEVYPFQLTFSKFRAVQAAGFLDTFGTIYAASVVPIANSQGTVFVTKWVVSTRKVITDQYVSLYASVADAGKRHIIYSDKGTSETTVHLYSVETMTTKQ